VKKIGREIIRYMNALRVFINQREILKASKSNKLIFLRPTPSYRCGGNVEHYYHFIFDLVLPLNALLKDAPSNAVFAFENFGIFTDLLQSLFPGRTIIENDFNIPREIKKIKLIGMNPRGVHLTRKTLESFRHDICTILEIAQTRKLTKFCL